MVTSVNTNINAMAAIQSLDQISNQMTSTQASIESGLSINSASDNPAIFTIAQGLRANVDALGAVSANLNTAVATVQAQTQGATSISDALQTLLKTVTQGAGRDRRGADRHQLDHHPGAEQHRRLRERLEHQRHEPFGDRQHV